MEGCPASCLLLSLGDVKVGWEEDRRVEKRERESGGRVSVCSGASVPEAGPEIVAAGHEAGVGG